MFLSSGIGVIPFRSMIKYAIDTLLPKRIVMFDSNRNAEISSIGRILTNAQMQTNI
jgi:ferredoxin-NADP reductase